MRNTLLAQGLLQTACWSPSSSPDQLADTNYPEPTGSHGSNLDGTADQDDILEPTLPLPEHLPPSIMQDLPSNPANSFEVADEELDTLIVRLRSHYRRAGISMLDGLLRHLGYRVARERIRVSLLRIDPVRRVFERIRIRRRKYAVAGPNALWHHDGQHG